MNVIMPLYLLDQLNQQVPEQLELQPNTYYLPLLGLELLQLCLTQALLIKGLFRTDEYDSALQISPKFGPESDGSFVLGSVSLICHLITLGLLVEGLLLFLQAFLENLATDRVTAQCIAN